MPRVLDPFRFVLIAVGGWMNQHQLQIIDYLREENRVLREQLGGRRVRFNDDQRRRLAAKAKGLGRKILVEVATIVTPETLSENASSLRTLVPFRNLQHCRSRCLSLRNQWMTSQRLERTSQRLPGSSCLGCSYR
jgi:hypothetical protein